MTKLGVLERIGKVAAPQGYPVLGTLLTRIEKTYRPEEVILFGSRAKGTHTGDSDWDLIVVLSDGSDEGLLDPMLAWEVQQGSGVHADIICVYASEFVADAIVANSLTREVVNDAIPLVAC